MKKETPSEVFTRRMTEITDKHIKNQTRICDHKVLWKQCDVCQDEMKEEAIKKFEELANNDKHFRKMFESIKPDEKL